MKRGSEVMKLAWPCAMGLSLLLLISQPLVAQQALSIGIDADTGILVSGHHDFTRYDTPGWCLAAGTWTTVLQHRSVESQLLLDTLPAWKDTLEAGATVALTRRCGSRFTAAGARPDQLEDLFELAVQQQNDSLARAVVARAIQTGAAGKQNLIMTITAYLQARPPRLAAAEALIAQIDAQRVDAVPLRVALRGQLLRFWMERGDTTRSRQVAAGMLVLEHKLPSADRLPLLAVGQPLFQAYQTLLTLAFLAHPTSPTALAGLRTDYAAAGGTASLSPTLDFGLPLTATREQLDSVGALPSRSDQALLENQKVLPPFHADYWFPATADTLQPRPGQVTLYLTMPTAADAPRLRRWLARYGAQGLHVVYVIPTHGYPQLYNHWDIGGTARQPWTPATEAKVYAQYIQDYQQLPVTVAVQTTQVQWRPAPDGRRMVVRWPTFSGHDNTGNSDALVLVGCDGHIVWYWGVDSQETAFEAVLAWAMAQQPGHPTIPAPAVTRAGPSSAQTVGHSVSSHI